MEFKLKLNDTFFVPKAPGFPDAEITVIQITPRFTLFLISGDGVKDPDVPRKMGTGAFAKWLMEMKAQKVKE